MSYGMLEVLTASPLSEQMTNYDKISYLLYV